MGTVTPLNHRAATPQLDPENLATRYLFQVRWESRHAALAFCIAQLIEQHAMSQATAERQALQAYAAMESSNHRLRVDINTTTSDLVMLRDGGGRAIALTVTDLRRLLDGLRRDECLPKLDPARHESTHLLEH